VRLAHRGSHFAPPGPAAASVPGRSAFGPLGAGPWPALSAPARRGVRHRPSAVAAAQEPPGLGRARRCSGRGSGRRERPPAARLAARSVLAARAGATLRVSRRCRGGGARSPPPAGRYPPSLAAVGRSGLRPLPRRESDTLTARGRGGNAASKAAHSRTIGTGHSRTRPAASSLEPGKVNLSLPGAGSRHVGRLAFGDLGEPKSRRTSGRTSATAHRARPSGLTFPAISTSAANVGALGFGFTSAGRIRNRHYPKLARRPASHAEPFQTDNAVLRKPVHAPRPDRTRTRHRARTR